MSARVLEIWQSENTVNGTTTILPDGCRDLLFYAPPKGRPCWQITDLDNTAYTIETRAGGYFKGFRLRAGTSINPALLCAMQGLAPDAEGILERVHSFTTQSALASEALENLNQQAALGGTVQAAAKGIGLRRMQQSLRRHTGRTPAQWLALARVRKAARSVLSGGALADISAEFGYADQPHMTRAFTRWLGTSPARLPAGFAGQLGPLGYG